MYCRYRPGHLTLAVLLMHKNDKTFFPFMRKTATKTSAFRYHTYDLDYIAINYAAIIVIFINLLCNQVCANLGIYKMNLMLFTLTQMLLLTSEDMHTQSITYVWL